MEPNKNAKTYDEILKQSMDEGWGFEPVRCKFCGKGAVGFSNEDARGDRVEDGITVCSCDVCGEEWWENDEDINAVAPEIPDENAPGFDHHKGYDDYGLG